MTTNQLDHTLLTLLQDSLPVTITRVTESRLGAVLCDEGARWTLTIDCDIEYTRGEGEEVLRNSYGLLSEQVCGRRIVGVQAPGDAFDPVFLFDDGASLRLLSEDENNPWVLECEGGFLEGLPVQDHDQWLLGNLVFDQE